MSKDLDKDLTDNDDKCAVACFAEVCSQVHASTTLIDVNYCLTWMNTYY